VQRAALQHAERIPSFCTPRGQRAELFTTPRGDLAAPAVTAYGTDASKLEKLEQDLRVNHNDVFARCGSV
jgi:hypothetical protein